MNVGDLVQLDGNARIFRDLQDTHPEHRRTMKIMMLEDDRKCIVLEEEKTTFSSMYYKVLLSDGSVGWVIYYAMKSV